MHSDTIKNAIYVSAAKLIGDEVYEDPGFYDSFRVSSAFPFFMDEFFLPVPNCDLTLAFEGMELKQAKKIVFMGWSLFEKWINGESVDDVRGSIFFDEGRCISETLSDAYTAEKFLTKSVQDRVNLLGDVPNPYFIENLRFHPDGGLYFFFQMDNFGKEGKYQKWFEQGLGFLADEGIGSDKTYGYGRFELITDKESPVMSTPAEPGVELTTDDKSPIMKKTMRTPSGGGSDFQLNLGLYRPSEAEQEKLDVDLPLSNFRVVVRGGFIANSKDDQFGSFYKHSARFFDSGSLFPFSAERIGEKINLKPDLVPHPVYREGKTIFIPTKKRYVEPEIQ